MLQEENNKSVLKDTLKNVRNKNEFRSLNILRDKLIIMITIQFTCLILLVIDVITVVYSNKVNSLKSIIGILALVTFFLISKIIEKRKAEYKTGYYNIVMLPIVKLVSNNWHYKKQDNTSNIIKEYIVSEFYNTNTNRFFEEQSIEGKISDEFDIQICEVNTKNVRGYGRHQRVNQLFNGIFVVVDLKSKTELNGYIYMEKDNCCIKINNILNEIEIKKIVNDFYKKVALDVEIIIKNEKIYFRIFSGNKFREHVFTKLPDEKNMIDYYYTLKFIKEMSDNIINKIIKNKKKG